MDNAVINNRNKKILDIRGQAVIRKHNKKNFDSFAKDFQINTHLSFFKITVTSAETLILQFYQRHIINIKNRQAYFKENFYTLQIKIALKYQSLGYKIDE